MLWFDGAIVDVVVAVGTFDDSLRLFFASATTGNDEAPPSVKVAVMSR
jgi:hypothetical protein